MNAEAYTRDIKKIRSTCNVYIIYRKYFQTHDTWYDTYNPIHATINRKESPFSKMELSYFFFLFQECSVQPEPDRPDGAAPPGVVLARERRQDVRRQGKGWGTWPFWISNQRTELLLFELCGQSLFVAVMRLAGNNQCFGLFFFFYKETVTLLMLFFSLKITKLFIIKIWCIVKLLYQNQYIAVTLYFIRSSNKSVAFSN